MLTLWAKIKAFLLYLAGYRAGDAAQSAVDKQAQTTATVVALEDREKTDDAVAAASDTADRRELFNWASRSR
jgi:hypothetical protein